MNRQQISRYRVKSYAQYLIAVAVMLSSVCSAEVVIDGLILPDRHVQLSSPLEAIVKQVNVNEGDNVKQDQVLSILYTSREELAAERATKTLEKVEFIWNANQNLYKQKAISEEEYLESKNEYELAVIEEKLAKAVLEDKTIRAPWDGQIIRIHTDVGEIVNRANPFIEMVNYDKVYAQMYLDAKYAAKAELGQEVDIIVPLVGEGKIPATISYIDPVIDSSSGLFRVKLQLENEDKKVKPGMTAVIRLSE